MNSISNSSESIVSTLCREVDYLNNRINCINHSLKYCQNINLINRLNNELKDIKERIKYILNISKILKPYSYDNGLSISFLREICNRLVNNVNI